MSDRRFEFWRKCLLATCVGMVLFGLGLVVFGSDLLPGFEERVSQALWGRPELPPEVVTYHRFVHGVLGATVMGWAFTMAWIVQHPFRKREPWAWWVQLLGPSIWFVFDCGVSAYFGVWPNVVLNVCSFVPLVVPLLLTWPAFKVASRTEEAPPL